MVKSWGAAGMAACLMGGCASSPPLHYYTLSEVAPQARATAPAGRVPLRLDRVTIPSELDRLQLVRRMDASRVQISELERWAAPLDEMIWRVLSADLAARLPVNLVADPNEPSLGEKRQLLAVDVQRFDTDASCGVTLRAAWTLKRPGQESARGVAETQAPAGGSCASGTGGATTSEAMSRALALLSDQLATVVVRPAP